MIAAAFRLWLLHHRLAPAALGAAANLVGVSLEPKARISLSNLAPASPVSFISSMNRAKVVLAVPDGQGRFGRDPEIPRLVHLLSQDDRGAVEVFDQPLFELVTHQMIRGCSVKRLSMRMMTAPASVDWFASPSCVLQRIVLQAVTERDKQIKQRKDD
jgi:hypothetical protein